MTAPTDLSSYWSQVCLRALTEQPAGWATQEQLAWDIFKTAEVIRGRTRDVLADLAGRGVLERIEARHQDRTMPVYRIDPEAIAALVVEIEQAAS